MGAKKAPFYRIVVADSRYPRDGRFSEEVGYYDPTKNPSLIKIDEERGTYWMGTGAQPSDTVRTLMIRTGILTDSAEKAASPEKPAEPADPAVPPGPASSEESDNPEGPALDAEEAVE
jgi:small subunit ribosomal protein S16